ncbi:hypothetical protein [Egibacter rhizosphaerae]|uniref:hypothetical protein n=1 Tax=Egibacter rhizosphaerae TaxID=1670831 RepID=UPI00197AD293|nr:hypothetical protein [Egibacter rhizosphaerae]
MSLLGQSILPSQITSMALVGFGASKRAVIVWQVVSITHWGSRRGSRRRRGWICSTRRDPAASSASPHGPGER